jgi:hypothetical protein
VDELLDAVVAGEDGLRALFEPVAPGLCAARARPRRVDASDEVGRGGDDPFLAHLGSVIGPLVEMPVVLVAQVR